jgi:hypothetical protein
MNYLVIGQIMGAKSVTRTDKNTKQVTAYCEITVQTHDYDKDGELVLNVEHINVDINYLDELKSNLQKFICVNFVHISSPKGSWMLPDEKMNFQIFDRNPLLQNKEIKK